MGRSVIVASGAHKRHLNIPGEKELSGRGVVYCSTCDGPLFKDLRIAVIGGGNSALEAAVPAPPAVYLFGSGLLGLIGICRRRKTA